MLFTKTLHLSGRARIRFLFWNFIEGNVHPSSMKNYCKKWKHVAKGGSSGECGPEPSTGAFNLPCWPSSRLPKRRHIPAPNLVLLIGWHPRWGDTNYISEFSGSWTLVVDGWRGGERYAITPLLGRQGEERIAKLLLHFPPKSLPACLSNSSGFVGRGGYNSTLGILETLRDLQAFWS